MTANDECKKWSLLSACDIVPPWRTVSMHSFGLPWSCSLWRWCLPFFSTRSLLLWFLALVMSIPTMIKRCCSNLGLKRCALEVQKLSSQNSDVFGCGNSQPLVPLTLLTTILISVGIASFDSSFRWWVQGKCEWQYVNICYMMLACCKYECAFLASRILSKNIRCACEEHFGTFLRAMLTMFQLTLGTWVPVARVLQETVSPYFNIFTILHKVPRFEKSRDQCWEMPYGSIHLKVSSWLRDCWNLDALWRLISEMKSNDITDKSDGGVKLYIYSIPYQEAYAPENQHSTWK